MPTITVTEAAPPAEFSQVLPLAGALLLGFLIVAAILVLLGKALSASKRRQSADETRDNQQ